MLDLHNWKGYIHSWNWPWAWFPSQLLPSDTPCPSHGLPFRGGGSHPQIQEDGLSQEYIPIPFVSNWLRYEHMREFCPMGSNFDEIRHRRKNSSSFPRQNHLCHDFQLCCSILLNEGCISEHDKVERRSPSVSHWINQPRRHSCLGFVVCEIIHFIN